MREIAQAVKCSDYQGLKYKYQLLRELMDYIPDVIYFKDRKGRLIMVNQAHAKGLGLRPEQVAGKTDFDIFPKERAEKMDKDDMQVMTTGKPIIDKIERATRADGVDNYVSTTKIPRYNEKGEITGLIGITRDITRRVQIRNLREEKENLRKRFEALEEANKLKSEFVSSVSHELRTPLAIIKESVNLIIDGLAGPVNEKQRDFLLRAGENVKRLQHIIDELLDVSRIEIGRLKLCYSLVNLNDLIVDSSSFFKKLADEKNIKLEYRMPGYEINIFTDVEKIIQVLNNLISNAIKFTEEGGKVYVEAKVLENRAVIGVIDTGIGISKENLPKLFNKFVQVSKLPGMDKKGVGLGLSIAKELVVMHGGRIWAESKPGIGSKFFFSIPNYCGINVLNKDIRDKINNLLKEGKTVFLINLLIVHYQEIRKKIKEERLADDFRDILEKTFISVKGIGILGFEIVYIDSERGEYWSILPEAAEGKVSDFCGKLKDNLKDYFAKNKITGIFINIGKMPFYSWMDESDQTTGRFYIRKINIGFEKRRFERVTYNAEIEISLTGKAAETARMIDISLGGISFSSNRKLVKDKEIEIRLKPPGAKEPVTILGRIVWVRPVDEMNNDSSKYKIGIEFLKLSNKNKLILTKLIKFVQDKSLSLLPAGRLLDI